MNIQNYMENALDRSVGSSPNDRQDIQDLVNRRFATFSGFLAIERSRGLVPPPELLSFSTSRGQDIVRLMLFRGLEELSEAFLAVAQAGEGEDYDQFHFLEELIDAFNYATSIFFLDQKYSTQSVTDFLHEQAAAYPWHENSQEPGVALTHASLGRLTVLLSGSLGDALRNRSWMNGSQDIYFAGHARLREAIGEVFKVIWAEFADWPEFVAFFLAKDEVLKFRLATKY
jgi:hypothetical protein